MAIPKKENSLLMFPKPNFVIIPPNVFNFNLLVYSCESECECTKRRVSGKGHYCTPNVPLGKGERIRQAVGSNQDFNFLPSPQGEEKSEFSHQQYHLFDDDSYENIENIEASPLNLEMRVARGGEMKKQEEKELTRRYFQIPRLIFLRIVEH
ncbi:hypothetical protein Tco_0295473 [Tanacetum coccineum]